jgi:hypothetical protein
MMTSTRLCSPSSELVTYPGAFSFQDLRWWWKGTNTKESKEFEETPNKATPPRSYLQECKRTLTNKGVEKRTISSQPSKASKPSSCSHSSQLELDQCLILEPSRKLSSTRWSKWKSRRIRLFQDRLSLAKLDQVHILEHTWTNRTR